MSKRTVQVNVHVVPAKNLDGYFVGLLRSAKTNRVVARTSIACSTPGGALKAAHVRAQTDLYVNYEVL